MGANPHANGGILLRDLRMPDFRDYAADVPSPGRARYRRHTCARAFPARCGQAQQRAAQLPGLWPGRDALQRPGGRLFEVTRTPMGRRDPTKRRIPRARMDACWTRCSASTNAKAGSRATCSPGGMGLFNCYEAFIHIIDSMFNQHAKWLKVTAHLSWRRKIASLNYLLASHVWRQDHNGFTHQDPGFIDHVMNKKAEVVRVYFPPDANCLLSVMDHCLRSRHYVNVVIAGKHPAPQWLTVDAAIKTLHRRVSAFGSGPATTRTLRPTWSWPAVATCPRWRRSPQSPSCASICPT